MNSPLLHLKKITRTFTQGDSVLDILKGVDLSLHSGESVALTGASGAGKSTLLQIAGLLEGPTSGEVVIEGEICTPLKEAVATRVRLGKIGFVYQFHHLLPEFNALENITLPQLLAGVSEKKSIERAYHLLRTLGLENRAHHRPSQLSGGEQQRVAILRALANNPPLLLADEPTGNLDERTAALVLEELLKLCQLENRAVLMVTHDQGLASKMDRIVRLHNGCVQV